MQRTSTRLFLLCALAPLTLIAQTSSSLGWPAYGGTDAGQRYSAAAQITPGNVKELQPVWSFHTGAIHHPETLLDKFARFEATPVLWNGQLYFDTPFNTVFALDARTGRSTWMYDPQVSHTLQANMVTARGVALWHSGRGGKAHCDDRVFMATIDRRLIALDAVSGKPCIDFGQGGTVDLSKGIYLPRPDLLQYTSPPIVVGNNVILGSSVGDNQTINVPSGAIRAFDVHTGQPVWTWEPVRWDSAVQAHKSGSGNAWAPLAADPEHDLVFIPTGSAAPDYFGRERTGDNRDADSIVALRASTGQKVWAFQLVHHDLWDYDTASQPLLFTFRGTTPAVAITNKTGMIYVFNRLTGEPLYPIEERPVPKSDIPGEVSWPTQPFSTLPPLQPLSFTLADLPPRAANDPFCRQQLGKLRYEGLFTPPSFRGTLVYPSALGGPNWGSSSFDPRSGVMYTRVSSAAYRLYLLPRRSEFQLFEGRMQHHWEKLTTLGGYRHDDAATGTTPAREYHPPDMGLGSGDASAMLGTPFEMLLQAMVAPDGTPCAPTPYGRLVATDLQTGKQLWSVAHGDMVKDLPGSFGVGGSLVTAGGLVIVASSADPYIRGYRSTDGALVWQARLPATANATPMSYAVGGRQYIVIAVGGHWHEVGDESDTVMAFALPGSPQPPIAAARATRKRRQ